MFESKYSKVLTIVLIVVIIAILGLLGFLAFSFYNNYVTQNDAAAFVDDFKGEVNADENTQVGDTNTINNNNENPLDQIQSTGTGSGSSNEKPTFKGFGVVGAIEIPKTNCEYPILDSDAMSPKGLETAVIFQWGAGINQVGNSVIVGHNYRNGMFFSNNKRLNTGDKILSLSLDEGGHLSHGSKVSFSSHYYNIDFYHLGSDGRIDYEALRKKALEYKPNLILAGFSAYPFEIAQNFNELVLPMLRQIQNSYFENNAKTSKGRA